MTQDEEVEGKDLSPSISARKVELTALLPDEQMNKLAEGYQQLIHLRIEAMIKSTNYHGFKYVSGRNKKNVVNRYELFLKNNPHQPK